MAEKAREAAACTFGIGASGLKTMGNSYQKEKKKLDFSIELQGKQTTVLTATSFDTERPTSDLKPSDICMRGQLYF